MKQKMNEKDLWWYLEKFGVASYKPSSGGFALVREDLHVRLEAFENADDAQKQAFVKCWKLSSREERKSYWWKQTKVGETGRAGGENFAGMKEAEVGNDDVETERRHRQKAKERKAPMTDHDEHGDTDTLKDNHEADVLDENDQDTFPSHTSK
ncbi:hypothetical protein BCR34DRAFT_584039 [Clohesyomyces aquaticus]|uniref:Uncharacterized protein n=1 Tax=Clohesyomyces aquaticus TaxID=1231657 RepID=A0A1Y2A3P4_9PLEO|nr:hypothetical protein BCR34DRAFT_584039 [Clohesyomyces aquaticus]